MTGDRAEAGRLWDTIVGYGWQETDCGGGKDPWGRSKRITLRVLMEAT